MDTPNDENRSVEPLMRPVEELEQRAYPGEQREEIMRDSEYATRTMNDDEVRMPGLVLPNPAGQPVPAAGPLPASVPNLRSDDADDNVDEASRGDRV